MGLHCWQFHHPQFWPEHPGLASLWVNDYKRQGNGRRYDSCRFDVQFNNPMTVGPCQFLSGRSLPFPLYGSLAIWGAYWMGRIRCIELSKVRKTYLPRAWQPPPHRQLFCRLRLGLRALRRTGDFSLYPPHPRQQFETSFHWM